MIAALRRVVDSLRGDGEYSVTVPPMDGALNPNNALEAAEVAASAPAPDNLCVFGDELLFTSGREIRAVDGGAGRLLHALGAVVTSLAAEGPALAIALDDGKVMIRGGPHDGAALASAGGRPLNGVTALAFDGPDTLLIAVGSENHALGRWKHDLMQLGRSGSVWRADLNGGGIEQLAGRLGFPYGVMPVEGGVLVAESWRHRLLILRKGRAPELALTDLPAYPARLAPAHGGGAWLALFAPRRQLTEFILREPVYRQRMMAEMEPDHWVGPMLAPMASFLEPLQGGTLKKLAAIKPWAPSRSYGLVVRLDAEWRPTSSYHSRADGSHHGVTSALEWRGRLYAASRGAHVVVAADLEGDA